MGVLRSRAGALCTRSNNGDEESKSLEGEWVTVEQQDAFGPYIERVFPWKPPLAIFCQLEAIFLVYFILIPDLVTFQECRIFTLRNCSSQLLS